METHLSEPATARREGFLLARSVRLIVRALSIAGRLGVLAAVLAAVASIAATFGDGRIAGIGLAVDWRVLGPALASGGAHAAALWLIADRASAVLGTLEAGDPFVPANAGRFRAMAFALGALELVRYLIQGAAALVLHLAGPPESGEMGVRFAPNLTALGAVAVLLLLAHVFAQGARLRRRDHLTI